MRRGSRHRSILAIASAAWALLTVVVLGSRAAAATVQPKNIQLTLAALPSSAGKVEAALRDSFARRSWVLELRTVASIDPHAIAAPHAGEPKSSLWLDLVAPRKALYLVDETQGLVYTRDLDVHDNPDTVELELITFVVESSIDAMRAGDIHGVPRAEFERQLAPPAPRSASARPNPVAPARTRSQTAAPGEQLALAGGYNAELVRDGTLGQGLFLVARWQPLRIGLDGSLRTQWPVHVTAADLDMRLWSSNVRLHAALPVDLGPRVLLWLGLGGGWEFTRVIPGGARGVAPFWASAPLLSGFAAVERSWGRFFVSMRLDLDVDLIQVRYRTTRAGITSTDWRPNRLRPSAAALVGFRY